MASGGSSRLSDLVRHAKRHNIKVVEVARRVIEDLVGGAAVHQGVVAAMAPFSYAPDIDSILARARDVNEAPLVVALDQIQDPHNLGAIIRSALALGAHGVVLPRDRACEVTPTVIVSPLELERIVVAQRISS